MISNFFKTARGVGPTNFISFDPNFSNTQLMFTGSWSGGLFYSEDAGESWINGGTDNFPPPIGVSDCSSSNFEEDVWFITTGGGDGYFSSYGSRATGLYRTINRGVNWELVGNPGDLGGINSSGNNIGSWALKRILIDPNSSEESLIVFVTGSRGLYKSNNGMADLSSNPGNETINFSWQNIYPEDPNEYILLLGGLKFYQKKSWTFDIAYKSLTTNTVDQGNLFVSGTKRYEYDSNNIVDKGFIIHSTDNGDTWTELIPFNNEELLLDYTRFSIRTTADNPNIIYFRGISVSDETLFTLFKYNLNNNLWESIPVPGWVMTKECAFDINPTNKDEMHSGDDISKAYSSDGGLTWESGTTYDVHADVEEIEYQPDGQKVWYAHHGGISSYDFTDWETKNIGLNCAEVLEFSMSKDKPEKMSMGLDHNGTMVSGDSYSSSIIPKWKQIWGGDGLDTYIDDENNDISYYSNQNGPFRRNSDAWLSNYDDDFSSPNDVMDWFTSFQANSGNTSTIYTVTTEVERHTNRGTGDADDWVPISNFSNISGNPYKLFSSKTDANLLFNVVLFGGNTSRKVYLNNKANSTNVLEIISHWVEIPEIPNYSNHYASDIVSDPDDINIFYVLHGYVNTQNPNYKITKYTYLGNNLMEDDASTITNNGFSLTDYTYNLPNINVNKLEILKGSNDFIIATNFDVWISDKSKLESADPDAWELIGLNLPHTTVRDMEVGIKFNLLRVGLKGRGVWEHCLPCEKKENVLIINQDQTISDEVRFSQDVIISNNSTVNVTGDVYMVSGTTITIENGSTLTIDGGTITSACDGFWNGIYVKGDVNLNQVTASNMGILRVKNGGTISNAYVAVHNYALNPNGNIDWSSTGGIIYCKSGAEFINNKKDVEFLSYQNYIGGTPLNDKSNFRETSFITDDQLIDGSTNILPHVSMWKTDGVRFQNCHFSSNDQYKAVGATGIYAVDADFTVTDYNDNPTIFSNLNNGIIVENYNDYYTVDVNHSEFEETPYGIKLLGVQEASVTENKFTVESEGITPYGLYMLECSGYKIEENQFYGDNPNYSTGLGVVVKNYNMEADNEIYRNEFFDLSIGILVNGKNGSSNTMNPSGLEILCNRYELSQPSYFDFAMTDKGVVSFYQGNSGSLTSDPAGNLFSNNSCLNENSLFVSNNSYNYIYFHHANTSATPYNGCYTPSHVYPVVSVGNFSDWEIACPSNLSSDHESELPGKKTLSENSTLEIASLTLNYEVLVDGGDQSLLLQSINDPLVTSLMLRNELITNTPYLSDETLIASINREPELNHWHLAEVMIGNSPVSNNVWVEFDLNSTMPEFLYNHVLSYQAEGSISPRSELEIQIKEQVDIKEKASSDFVRGQMKVDNNEEKNQEIIDFYELDDSKIAVRRKVAALVSSQDYTEARTVLSVYDDESEDDAYAVVQEFIININEGLDSLTQVEKETLYVIANGEKYGKYRAQAILVDKDNAQFDHPIVLPDFYNKNLKTSKARRNIEVTPLLASYPNPADEKIYFTIQLPAEMESAYIEVYTVEGKFVKQIDVTNCFGIIELETSDLKSGVYISRLLVDKQNVSTQKFMIKH